MANEFMTNKEYSVILRDRFHEAQIVAIRKGTKLPLLDMSKATGITYSHLHKWLNNDGRMSDEKLKLVAEFLNGKL